MRKYKQAGYESKKRNNENRKRNSIILLAAEGNNKTETLYFSELAKEQGKIVKYISTNYTDPENMIFSLVNEFEKKSLSLEEGDMGYCLIDSDFENNKNAKIAKADRIAEKNGLKILVSGPCFEVWFLCHYTYSTKQYSSSEEVIDALKKYCPSYAKSKKDMYSLTKDNINTAIDNAERLKIFCERAGYKYHTVDFVPSTDVYELVEKLFE